MPRRIGGEDRGGRCQVIELAGVVLTSGPSRIGRGAVALVRAAAGLAGAR